MGKLFLVYDDLVEECMCFGWIDGVVKKYGEGGCVQCIILCCFKRSFLLEFNW